MSTIFTAPRWPTPVFDPGFARTSRVFVNAFPDTNWPPGHPVGFPSLVQVNTIVGRVYNYIKADSLELATNRQIVPIPGLGYLPAPPFIPEGQFTATQTIYWLAADQSIVGTVIMARVLLIVG